MSKFAKLSPLVVTICGVLILGLSFMLMSNRNMWRDKFKKTDEELTSTKDTLDKTSKKLKKTETDLTTTKTTLDQTKAALDQTTQTLKDTQDRADKLDADLKDLTAKHDAQTQELQDKTTKLDAAQKSVEELTAKTTEQGTQLTTLNAAKLALEDKAKQQEAQLNRLMGNPVPLPQGLSGKVLAVDKTWNFVVVSCGKTSGALPGGKLIVSRDGKSIGVVKIVTCYDDKSIADIVSVNEPKNLIQVNDEAITQQ